MLGIKFGSVYFTENSGYRSSKIVVCGTRNIPYQFPYCESRTTGTENGYVTTIFQTSVTGIFDEIDTSIKFISVGTSLGLPVTSPHGNFATATSPHGNFATLSYIENLHCLHRNKTLNSRLP